IALGCALVRPLHDRVDLLGRERWIVLVLLDADMLVDEPGRHLAARDLGLDRARPRTRVLVGEERHRRHHARPMAGLTRSLQDRRDVFCERHLAITGARRCILRAQRRHTRRRDRPNHQAKRAECSLPISHLQPPSAHYRSTGTGRHRGGRSGQKLMAPPKRATRPETMPVARPNCDPVSRLIDVIPLAFNALNTCKFTSIRLPGPTANVFAALIATI